MSTQNEKLAAHTASPRKCQVDLGLCLLNDNTLPEKSQIAPLLDLADFYLRQENRCKAQALASADGQQRRHPSDALAWCQGREELLKLALQLAGEGAS